MGFHIVLLLYSESNLISLFFFDMGIIFVYLKHIRSIFTLILIPPYMLLIIVE